MNTLHKMNPLAISVRRGFATNSSSSHSIIFTSNPDAFKGFSSESSDFGWNWFLQSSREDKLAYIYQSFCNTYNAEEMAGMLGIEVNELESVAMEGYIDHDSEGLIDIEMAIKLLNSDNLAVLGGNDNEERPEWTKQFMEIDQSVIRKVSDLYHKFVSTGKDREVFIDDSYRSEIYVLEQGVVTTFNAHNGVKVRYNMNDDKEVYLSVPELVDIKITDYCTFGCEYCYQDSTPEGIHGDTRSILDMIEYMKDLSVFELAIGGGEPTLHPDFLKIINKCVKKNKKGFSIKPNFTTRNMTFFKSNMKRTSSVLENIGGYAFSVDNPKDVSRMEVVFMGWVKKLEDSIHALTKTLKDAIESKDYDQIKHLKDSKVTEDTRTINHILSDLLFKCSYQIVLGAMNEAEYIETVQSIQDSITRMKQAALSLVDHTKEGSSIFYKYKFSSNDKMSEDGKKIKEALEGYRLPFNGGILSEYHLEDNAPTVMLLGYKDTGRGTRPLYDYTDNAIDQTLNINDRAFYVGIDTAAAIQMKQSLNRLNVPAETYYTKEGVASCYIDAVKKTMSSSSYCAEVNANTMDEYSKGMFLTNFGRYQKQGMSAISMRLI